MSKPIYLSLVVIIFCAFLGTNCSAQAARADSSSQQVAFNNAVAFYNNALNIQAPVYSGPEYYFYDPHIKGNAYYQDSNGFSKGSVYFDGTLYNNMSLLYDVNTDQLVGLFPNHISKFILHKEKVTAFDYLGSHFINISKDTLPDNTALEPAYYRQLYAGKSEVLARYTKSMQTSTSTSNLVEYYFSVKNYFYIRKNNVFHSVSGKGSVLSLFKERKAALRKFIKDNNIDFKDKPEEAMVKVANWYDHLSN
ncbi:hypothetical protein [Mucilaginibacter sp. L3T2-6]|uniref:hypothetical protein n=1 Tax=Mucilaginibacter sp. L3T2-6 TaxID=3062491 RepID=UPI00267744CA|nr:hypothetical protein [Mucilaginibacter sp. L3T2-6]MDO3645072.1 hypothetical protein [Mucilaginibacter sp. L3T2-6]MDV6217523.1 hypothetical protein [Mucilaginibacter sp. L3T2-6]